MQKLVKGFFITSNKKNDRLKEELKKKYTLNDCSVKEMERGLRTAANNNKVNDIVHFLDLGVNINAFNNEKKTALHYAVKKGHSAAAEELLKSGALYNIPDIEGKTALDYAKETANTQILKLFPEKKLQ